MADNPVNDYLAASGFYGPNPYSQYQNQALPMPAYAGAPTNAMGQPIAQPPGTTLNTPAAPPAPAPAQQNYNQGPIQWGPGNMGFRPGQEQTGALAGKTGLSMQAAAGLLDQFGPPLQGASTPAASSGSSAPGAMDFLQARSLLANPGPVTTPGANGPSPAPQSNVLQSFLANNQGGTGAGNYSNKGFFNTLNALKSGTQPGAG